MGRKETKEKKPDQFKQSLFYILFQRKIYELVTKYSQIIVVSLTNVGSRQVQDIRRTLSKRNAILVIGKNTLVRKVIQTRASELSKDHPYYDDLAKFGNAIKDLDAFKNLITGKVGFVFSDEAVFELKPLIEANKVETSAKVGTVAPIDVIIPPGATNMDPSQISFFHALQVPTKIEKGQIQITKDFQVCKAGVKVGQSQAALLQKLGKKPFSYGMEVLSCYESGSVLNKQQVSINMQEVLSRFSANVNNIAAISLANGWVNEASAPHLVVSAFKNLAAIGFGAGIIFDQIKVSASAPVAQQQQKQAEKAPEKPAPAPAKVEEPEEDVDMGGLFD